MMDANAIFLTLSQMDKRYTRDHASIMAAHAKERGLTPFAEFSPMLFKNKQTGKMQIQFKDHYSLVHRWAQDRGGYRRTWKRLETKNKNDSLVEVTVIANRDYSIVLQAVAVGRDYDEEMSAYARTATGLCTAEDYNRSKRFTGKSIQWYALKRATEAALIDCFGKEPSRARQIYTLSHVDKQAAAGALYGEPEPQREALPAPALDVVDGEYTEAPPAPTAPAPAPAPVIYPAENGTIETMTPAALKTRIMQFIGKMRVTDFSYASTDRNVETYRGAVVGTLSKIFNGDVGYRHGVTEFLTGEASSKKLDDTAVCALHKWLWQQDEATNEWGTPESSKIEARAIISQVLREAGQLEIPLQEQS